jgi:formylglycine-generating enzyme required for sulfatase activity
MQKALGRLEMKLDLGKGVSMTLKRIPAGEFAMGSVKGANDEFPMAKVKIARPFWMGATEVSLKQFQQFNPKHKNGYYDMHYKDQVKPGYLMDNPDFPAIRVSWDEAMAFCAWLSKKTGKDATLPTEAQWEWACRAGTGTPFWYGDLNSNFSRKANMADKTISKLAVKGVNPQPIRNPDKFWDFVPKDSRFDDKVLHLARVEQYEPNPWGLHNMHGNVAEWTRNSYHSYPYDPTTASALTAGKQEVNAVALGKMVVRGGSWRERPNSCRSSFRLPYPNWQKVYNVGFRVIIED